MRRLLVLCSAVGLLCGVLGCYDCSGHAHGRCDCDDGPLYGCHYEDYCAGGDHGYGGGAVVHSADVHPGMQPEPLKAMPKEAMPKEEAK
jgi:hypothetical protein